jgi:hypothetical protein
MCKGGIWVYKRFQAPPYSLGGYSHQECWSRTWWNKSKQKKLKRRENNIFEPILEKLSTIASGATLIGSTGRAPDDDREYGLLTSRIIDFIVGINSLLHSHREGSATSRRKTTLRFWVLEQPNKAHDKLMILKLHHRDKKLECHGRKDHEGKTSGSVLHGLVYAYECALLVNFRIHDAKKIPVDALGTLRTTGILSL